MSLMFLLYPCLTCASVARGGEPAPSVIVFKPVVVAPAECPFIRDLDTPELVAVPPAEIAVEGGLEAPARIYVGLAGALVWVRPPDYKALSLGENVNRQYPEPERQPGYWVLPYSPAFVLARLEAGDPALARWFRTWLADYAATPGPDFRARIGLPAILARTPADGLLLYDLARVVTYADEGVSAYVSYGAHAARMLSAAAVKALLKEGIDTGALEAKTRRIEALRMSARLLFEYGFSSECAELYSVLKNLSPPNSIDALRAEVMEVESRYFSRTKENCARAAELALGMLQRVNAYKLSPTQVAELHVVAGYALHHAGRYGEALACFETAQRDPTVKNQVSSWVLEECRRGALKRE